MLRILFSIFIVLHGLVHMWYVTLSQGWVPFEPNMGWSGKSWLLSSFLSDAASRTFATSLYALATLAFVIGGFGVFTQADWWEALVLGAAIISSVAIVFFWDGSAEMMVEKGLLGALINLVLIISLVLFDWPSSQL